ncbi:spermatogenesis associated 6-like protein isoform X5 [Ictidomys tridecemlineatus]
MPLEAVVELQIRAISCPGVFLPDKQDVYLGVYLLNQYVETACFPSVFPIVIQQILRFKKVFENAIDPGAVAELLERLTQGLVHASHWYTVLGFLARFELIQLVPPVWEELAYYEENTRDFLFPEPKLTPSHPGIHREVLMKTAIGFPGIAPKLEFSTRTAIRECMFLHRNRFHEERCKSRMPLSTSRRPVFPLNNKKKKPKENSPDRQPRGTQPRTPSPYSTRRFFLDKPAQMNLGNNFKISEEGKPPFVVRHVIKEPDERIVLRNESLSSLNLSKFGKPLPKNQGDADFHREASLATSQQSTSTSPLDQPFLRERFHPGSQPTWKKIHERVCSLLTSHRAQQHVNKEDSTFEINDNLERPVCSPTKYPLHEEIYF